MALVDLPSASDRVTKPEPWDVDPGRVVPEWQWAWDHILFGSALWEGGGPVYDYGSDRLATANLPASGWEVGRYGHSLVGDLANTTSAETMKWPTQPSGITGLSGFSVIFCARRTGDIPTFGRFFGTNNSDDFAVGENGANEINFTVSLTDGSAKTSGNVSVPVDTDIVFTVTRRPGIRPNARMWEVGGTFLSETSFRDNSASGTVTNPSDPWIIGMEETRSRCWPGPIHAAYVLDTFIPREMEQAFARDPFVLLRPQQQIIVRVPSAGDQTIGAPVAPATTAVIAPSIVPGAVSISAPGADSLAESTAAQIAASIGLSAPVAPGLANTTAPAMSPGDPTPSIAVATALVNSTASAIVQGTALAAPVAPSTVTSTAPTVSPGPTTVATPAPLVVTSVSAVQFASAAITGSIVYAVASEVAEEVEVKITHPYL